MTRTAPSLVILAALAGTFACSSGEQASSDDQPSLDSVVAAQTKTLASVDVGYGTIEFYKTTSEDGTVDYGVSELASAYASSTPFAATMANERHTMLELFLAVAPDQEPPEELVANQGEEAKRLGRDTDEIQPAPFDKAAPVEKAAAACVSNIWASPSSNCYAWKNKLEMTTTSGNWLPVGDNANDFSHFTGESVTMGVCNATSTGTIGYTVYNKDPNSGSYYYRSYAVSVPAYTWWKDWWVSNTTWGPDCTGSPICFPNVHPARYAVIHDPGANATLMSAESYYTAGCLL